MKTPYYKLEFMQSLDKAGRQGVYIFHKIGLLYILSEYQPVLLLGSGKKQTVERNFSLFSFCVSFSF